MTDERRTINIPGWVGFSIFVAVCFLAATWFVHWLFFVPGDRERAMLCPKHEQRAEVYRQLADLRPLKDYELTGWATSDEYVKRWCQ